MMIGLYLMGTRIVEIIFWIQIPACRLIFNFTQYTGNTQPACLEYGLIVSLQFDQITSFRKPKRS